MNFVSGEFACFLIATLFLAFVITGWHSRRIALLLLNLVFFGWTDLRFLWFLAFLVAICWGGSFLVEKFRRPFVIALCVVIATIPLICLKYLAFFLQEINSFIGLAFPRPLHLTVPKMVLPLGVSFLTFQAIGYLVDVYRGKVSREPSLLITSLFISFFPYVTSGPIGRAQTLMPQFVDRRFGRPTWEDVRIGVFWIIFGLIQKLVFADNFGLDVDRVFDGAAPSTPGTVLGATYLYCLQLYCDFYGYSLMAMGCAKLFGVAIQNNFDHPYWATSISRFWQKWHISLTEWLRDYIFRPITADVFWVSQVRRSVAILIVFFVCGLWHGAGLTFILWGCAHGILVALDHLSARSRFRAFLQSIPRISSALGAVVVFNLVTMLWVLFRSQTLRQALDIYHLIGRAFMLRNFTPLFSHPRFLLLVLLIFLVVELIDRLVCLSRFITRIPAFLFSLVIFLMLMMTYLGAYREVSFLYFRF